MYAINRICKRIYLRDSWYEHCQTIKLSNSHNFDRTKIFAKQTSSKLRNEWSRWVNRFACTQENNHIFFNFRYELLLETRRQNLISQLSHFSDETLSFNIGFNLKTKMNEKKKRDPYNCCYFGSTFCSTTLFVELKQFNFSIIFASVSSLFHALHTIYSVLEYKK